MPLKNQQKLVSHKVDEFAKLKIMLKEREF